MARRLMSNGMTSSWVTNVLWSKWPLLSCIRESCMEDMHLLYIFLASLVITICKQMESLHIPEVATGWFMRMWSHWPNPRRSPLPIRESSCMRTIKWFPIAHFLLNSDSPIELRWKRLLCANKIDANTQMENFVEFPILLNVFKYMRERAVDRASFPPF